MLLQHQDISAEGAPFERPVVDSFSYRLITLDNGLEALLISDPDAEKAAAAMDVRVGSLKDPEDVAGLAHFLEHMLFYSSEKYPTEDEYSKFISQHGGHTNAYTSNESTNYHFDVNPDHLPLALDRFSQFFICPLISEDGVDREANAVDSENGKNLNSDPWKKLQLWKHTANKSHPFSHFSTGNLDTLVHRTKAAGMSIHQRVRQFYNDEYSANIMKLSVSSSHTLDELETLVREHFSGIENKNLAVSKYPDNAVTSEHCGILIKVVPERDGHVIELQWPTLSEHDHFRAAPSHYVSHLLGHEAEGSAFAYLKAKGWVISLVAGEASTSYSSRSFFQCRMELTEAGHAHAKEVVAVIFRYIDLMKQPGGVNERVWQEMKTLSQLKFDYRDKLNPYSYVSSLAHGMQVYDDDVLLKAMYNVPLEYNTELITRVLDDLTPANARVMWSSKSLESETNDTEPWYGTRHSVEKIPQDWMEAWNTSASNTIPKELHLPDPNPFIPTELSLLASDGESAPVVVHETDMVRLWHRPEPSFKVPKAVFFIHLHLPESYTSPYSAVLTQLYAKLVNDALSEVSYPAELAGLHYNVRSSVPGIMMTLNGYHSTLDQLAGVVMDAMLHFTVDADRFAIVKEKLGKDFANMRFDQPYQIALYNLSILAEANRWHINDYINVLPDITVEALQSYFDTRLLSRCSIEAYSIGNLSVEASTKLIDTLQEQLRTKCSSKSPFASEHVQQRVTKPAPGRPAVWVEQGPNPSNNNSSAVVAFQLGLDSPRLNALAELVTHIGKREAFYQLRTVEQLGYITFCTAYWTLAVRNIVFIIQSSVKSAEYLASRIEAFLPKLETYLKELSEEEFAKQVEELCKVKLEKPKRLRELASKDWREIEDGTVRFDRQVVEAAEIRSVTKQEMVDFYRQHVMNKDTRRKIVTLIRAAVSASEEDKDAAAVPSEEEEAQQQQEEGQ